MFRYDCKTYSTIVTILKRYYYPPKPQTSKRVENCGNSGTQWKSGGSAGVPLYIHYICLKAEFIALLYSHNENSV